VNVLGHHVLFEGRWQGQALQQRIFNCSLQIPSTDGSQLNNELLNTGQSPLVGSHAPGTFARSIFGFSSRESALNRAGALAVAVSAPRLIPFRIRSNASL
jgi:hypothetical protein